MKNWKIKKSVFIIAMMLLAWAGCKKENKQEPEEQKIDDVILIELRDNIILGDTLPKDSIKITHPAIDINVVNDSSEFIEKKAQLDVNADGEKDFEITVSCKLYTPQFIYEESIIKIKALNEDSYILADSVYERVILNDDGIIQKTNYDELFPKLLSKNEKISLKKDRWRNSLFPIIPSLKNFQPFLILSTFPTRNDPKHYTANAGVWRDAKDKYIGFHYRGQLGWIKMSIPGRSHVIVSEIGLSY
jgi:hypothetical protein